MPWDELVTRLGERHAIIIEGMGRYDHRDPVEVASQVCRRLREHWGPRPPTTAIVVIQGDPLTERGISAITRAVASELRVDRCLMVLDEAIDPTHAPNADREGVVLELRYSQLVTVLQQKNAAESLPETPAATPLQLLTGAIDEALAAKNSDRRAAGKPPLADYYRDFALLQEVPP